MAWKGRRLGRAFYGPRDERRKRAGQKPSLIDWAISAVEGKGTSRALSRPFRSALQPKKPGNASHRLCDLLKTDVSRGVIQAISCPRAYKQTSMRPPTLYMSNKHDSTSLFR